MSVHVTGNQGLVKLFILDAKITEWYEEADTHVM